MVTRFPSASVTLETARAVPPPRDEEEAEADEEDETDPKLRALARLEIPLPDALARMPCRALRRAASEALSAILRPSFRDPDGLAGRGSSLARAGPGHGSPQSRRLPSSCV